MSDVSGTEENADSQPYHSEIDPAFSAAWNAVYGAEDAAEDAEGGGEAGAAGSGDSASAASDQGAAGAGDAAAAQGSGNDLDSLAGTLKSAGDIAGAGGDAAAGAGDGSGAGDSAAAEAASGVEAETVIPLFSQANEAINTRMESAFRTAAEQEVRNEIDNTYFDLLEKTPYELVGIDVPSIRAGEETTRLKDTREAEEYQKATKRLIDAEIQAKTDARLQEARPMASVLQDSVQMFQNNQDLIPGTKQYDKELADAVVEAGKSYELRVNDKLYGYQVPMQPIINQLRSMLSKQRGASGVTAEQARQAAAARAAQQQRNDAGQFQGGDGPQAGIASKAGLSGAPGEDDDMSQFWIGVGMPGRGNI